MSVVAGQQCSLSQCSCSFCSVANSTTCPINSRTTVAGASSISSCICIQGAIAPTNGVACTLCGTGTYANTTGLTVCQQCPVGTFLTATGATSAFNCTWCGAGTYQVAVASSGCTQCNAGTWSTAVGASSASVCTACVTGTYSTGTGATSNCTACPVGQFCSTVATAPAPCTMLVSNAYWISTGVNTTNCQWACSPSYWLSSGSCVGCSANSWCSANTQNTCPINSISLALAGSQNQCLCAAGYYGDGSVSGTSPCNLCFAGYWCPGGNSNLTVTCPANSSSPSGSSVITQCQCLPGYMGANGTACSLCPPNTICTSGQLSVCPNNTASSAGTGSSCTANAGYYSSAGSIRQCPVNSYCTGGTNIVNCSLNFISPVGSVSSLACYGAPGYVGVNNLVATPCPANTWCWTGVLNNCPGNTVSLPMSRYPTDCICQPGYSGVNGGPCSAVLPGTYKSKNGSSAAIPCPPNTFAVGFGSTDCTPVTLCPVGQWASVAYTATTDNICSLCTANFQCQNNIRTACPGPSVSPVGSSLFTNCSCPAGMFGTVTALGIASCQICQLGMYCPSSVCQCT